MHMHGVRHAVWPPFRTEEQLLPDRRRDQIAPGRGATERHVIRALAAAADDDQPRAALHRRHSSERRVTSCLLNLIVTALGKRPSPPDSPAGLYGAMVSVRDVALRLPPKTSGPLAARGATAPLAKGQWSEARNGRGA
jgi:hypothetical protein